MKHILWRDNRNPSKELGKRIPYLDTPEEDP
jgi:hypothetical protein